MNNANCSCGALAGGHHPEGFDSTFGGGAAVVRDTSYDAAHGVADWHRERGYDARVYCESGFGWAVQVRKTEAV